MSNNTNNTKNVPTLPNHMLDVEYEVLKRETLFDDDDIEYQLDTE